MSRLKNIYKSLHKWPGFIISFVLLYYGITGIIMNHREFLSAIDISRKVLPEDYKYMNWNNAALKGNLIISKDSILIYGNIGIWLTDSVFSNFTSFNNGLPEGSDNRKIFDVHKDNKGKLYAATLFGLYAYDHKSGKWKQLKMLGTNERFVGIESVDDTLFVINRSYLFKGLANGINTKFTRIELPAPEGYVNKVSLFSTMWQIHSGEIFGLSGKLVVDLLGIITIFLSATGIIYFIFPHWLKYRSKNEKPTIKITKITRWSLYWHNKLGAWTFIFLIILLFTGIFLRPPFLIAIANAKVSPLKYSHLDQPNPWYDKLRDLIYDKEKDIFLLSTSEGIFYMDKNKLLPFSCETQPPVSVMGINTFKPFAEGAYLIGSFSGLFVWHPLHSEIYNLAQGKLYSGNMSGRPVGDFKITGTITDGRGNLYMADYDQGIIPLYHNYKFPTMPENISEESKMSLWNLCLEIHTGRFFKTLMGDFYILIVPLTGLVGILVVISGYLLWRKKYKRKND